MLNCCKIMCEPQCVVVFCQGFCFQSVKKVKIYFRDEMDRTLMLRSKNFIKNGNKLGKEAALTSQVDRDCWAKRFKRSYLNSESELHSGGKKVATVKSVAEVLDVAHVKNGIHHDQIKPMVTALTAAGLFLPPYTGGLEQAVKE